MSIDECMEKHTEEQLHVWLAWFNMDMNRPSRLEWYLMQLTAEVRSSNSRKAVEVASCKIKFTSEAERAPWNPEKAMVASKAAWLGSMTAPVIKVTG